MLLTIPDVLNAAQVKRSLEILNAAEWIDGRVTAGHQSARAKDNMQLPEGSPAARELGDMILNALARIRCSSQPRCRCAFFRHSSIVTRVANRSACMSTM